MPTKFDIKDPRGKRVVCSEERWQGHVLVKRPNLTGQETEIQQTIETPTAILKDADFPNRENYYRLLSATLYLKVVVDFDVNGKGIVVTAFPTDSPKQGEDLIWMH